MIRRRFPAPALACIAAAIVAAPAAAAPMCFTVYDRQGEPCRTPGCGGTGVVGEEAVAFGASGFGAVQYGQIFLSSRFVLPQKLHLHMCSPPRPNRADGERFPFRPLIRRRFYFLFQTV